MKNVQEAPQRARFGKWYQFTTFSPASEFERLLKPFKGDVSGEAGAKFTGIHGGTENA